MAEVTLSEIADSLKSFEPNEYADNVKAKAVWRLTAAMSVMKVLSNEENR